MSPYPLWNGQEAAASILRLSPWLEHLSRKALSSDRRESESYRGFSAGQLLKVNSVMLDASFLLDFLLGIDDLTCLVSEKLQIMRQIKNEKKTKNKKTF